MRHELKEGTADGWLIIRGLAEGNIVGRRLPIFLQDIFGSTELLRLHSTIQAQAEGELRFCLSGGNSVSASRRHTQALKEDILLAAESTKVNRQVLYDLLRTLKRLATILLTGPSTYSFSTAPRHANSSIRRFHLGALFTGCKIGMDHPDDHLGIGSKESVAPGHIGPWTTRTICTTSSVLWTLEKLRRSSASTVQ